VTFCVLKLPRCELGNLVVQELDVDLMAQRKSELGEGKIKVAVSGVD
jgi:hypothetical protein